jgi:hypothetical protein
MTFKHTCNFICEDGRIGLVRCEYCNIENYCSAVMMGICYSCGYDANEEAKLTALDEMTAMNQETGLYDMDYKMLPDKEAS